MFKKLAICIFILLLSQLISVECTKNIGLSYHYKKEGEVLKPICENKDEYDVPEGEDVVLNFKKLDLLSFAQCNLQHNESVITANSFVIVGDSNIYRGQLKPVINGPYNCSFYISKEAGKQIEPTSVFNNIVYVRISCLFKIKLYREKPIFLSVNVNGQTLIPSKKSLDNVITSKYKYNKEQKLMVVCKKHNSVNGIVELIIPGVNNKGADPKLPINAAEFQLNQPQALGPYFTMKCYLHDANNTFEVYSIDFSPMRTLNEIDVDGLKINNIIENKFDNSLLYYKYTDIEEINLKCSMCCANQYCQMEMWYNAKKINYTQWMYNVRIDISHILVLTPADNSSVIKCIGFRKPATEILTQTLTISLIDATVRQKESTTTPQISRCSNGENGTDSDPKCSTDEPKHPQPLTPTTMPTTVPRTMLTTKLVTPPTTVLADPIQSSTPPYFPENSTADINYKKNSNKTSIIWSVIIALVVMAAIVLAVCLICKRRKRQRPQHPLPESVELATYPSTSQNQEPPVYEEIPSTDTRPTVAPPPKPVQLRRIPDMRMDRQNGKLIVKGKAIDLKKLLQEAEYEEMK